MERKGNAVNKPLIALVAVIAIAATGILLHARSSGAAEPPDEPNVNAVAVIDMTPIVDQLQAMQQEVASMRESMDAMQESLQEAQIMQMEAVAQLKRLTPSRWDYKILRVLTENAAKAEGEKGWEMVATTPQGWIFFRKPIAEEPAPGSVR